jgi:uncharacterized protein (UPF0276 family)
MVDPHEHNVVDPALELYAHSIRRFRPAAYDREWDDDLPALSVLMDRLPRRIASMEREVVCGMPVESTKATGTSVYNGKTY